MRACHREHGEEREAAGHVATGEMGQSHTAPVHRGYSWKRAPDKNGDGVPVATSQSWCAARVTPM
jgi:hypothetical protein